MTKFRFGIVAFSYLFFISVNTANSATFIVDNTADADNAAAYTQADGSNTLRKCMRLANANAGLDTIQFNISSAPYLITVTSATLPVLTGPVYIDGLSQPGASAGNPLIEIDGGVYLNAFEIATAAGGSTIKGLVIYGANRGIYINSSSGNTILANHIGTNQAATAVAANVLNWNGIEIGGASANNIIGGTAGINTRNVISGAAEQGIRVQGTSTGTQITGNYIGTNIDASAAIPNGQNGIFLLPGSDNTIIGGSTLNHGNIISGNTQRGIFIQGSSDCIVRGNKLGLGSDGNMVLANALHGIEVQNSLRAVIGGSLAAERNFISGNTQMGIRLENGDNAVIKNNYIGVDETGLLDRGNIQMGLLILLSDDVMLGGSLAGEGNIISGNDQRGVGIENNSARPVIKGNIIGLGADISTLIGNSQHGLHLINSVSPVIGGSLTAERNFVSGNIQYGIRVENGDSAIIQGNYIGTDGTGLQDKGNNQVGLYVINSDDVILGGSLAGEGNVISGNTERGAVFDNSPRPVVKGNVIGLGSDVVTAIGNSQQGLHIINSTTALIGGNSLAERNYVSSNGGHGMHIVGSPYTIIKGNYIGVDLSGLLNRGNNNNGILLDNCRESVIGGGSRNERNITCGSKAGNGIEINGDSKRCIIQGNFSGIGADGVTDIGNWTNGINIYWTSDTLLVGGSNFMERNVCSCNGKSGNGDGIRSEGPDGHTIQGNFCGVDSTGTIAKGNAWAGISLNESNDNLIGGSGPFEGNICSGNHHEGMWLRNVSRNRIYGNSIGTDRSGTLQIGNQNWGLAISDQGPNFDNIIGGSPANANIIAYNLSLDKSEYGRLGQGVFIYSSSHRNRITFNKIYCNAGIGIDKDGVGNENIAAPVIIKSLGNSVNGTGTPGDSVHVYKNLTADAGTACDCEGEIYLGKTIVDNSGNWTLTHNLGLSFAEARTVTATQTNPTNSTSEFSACMVSCDLMPAAQASDTIINLFDPKVVNLTSTATANPLIPLPLKFFWSVDVPDTTGSSVFAYDSIATLNLSAGNFPVSANGSYQVYLLVSQASCIDTVLLNIQAYHIPNLVTPNNDGLNDRWDVTRSSELFDAEIYNRWGKLVFAKEGYTNEWDVSGVTDGIYYFQLKGREKTLGDYKGWIQVIK